MNKSLSSVLMGTVLGVNVISGVQAGSLPNFYASQKKEDFEKNVISTSDMTSYRGIFSHYLVNPTTLKLSQFRTEYNSLSRRDQLATDLYYAQWTQEFKNFGQRNLKNDVDGLGKQFSFPQELTYLTTNNLSENLQSTVSNLAKEDCGNVSCLSYLYDLSEEKASELPNHFKFGNWFKSDASWREKRDFLVHYQLALVNKESGGRNSAVSKDNASGLTQITAPTGNGWGLEIDSRNWNKSGTTSKKIRSADNRGKTQKESLLKMEQHFDERFFPEKNLRASLDDALRYLNRNDNWNFTHALIHHNAGPRGVNVFLKKCISRHERKCPSYLQKETKPYIKNIYSNFKKLELIKPLN